MQLCWGFTNTNATFAKFFTNGYWPGGWNWFLLPVSFISIACQGRGVQTLSGPARADALTEMPIQGGKKAYVHRGLEMVSWFAACSRSFSWWGQPRGAQLSCGPGSPCGGWQAEGPALSPAPALTVCPGLISPLSSKFFILKGDR